MDELDNECRPSLASLRQLSAQSPASTVATIYRELHADLETPVSAFLKLRQGHEKNAFLLESVRSGDRIARFSFIGTSPYKVLTQNGCDPLPAIEQELAKWSLLPQPHDRLPQLTGGAVGYIGYDCIKYFEPTVSGALAHQRDLLALPESVFLFFKSLIAFDHVTHTLLVMSHVDLQAPPTSPAAGTDGSLAGRYAEAEAQIADLIARLSGPVPARTVLAPELLRENKLEETINVGAEGYCGMVDALKEHIVAGDIFQAVPSQRISRALHNVSAFDVYRQLRIINPSPYMFYFELDGFEIVGASPELLVSVSARDGTVTNHPIAGTRKRGASPAEDRALAADLLADPKERAEHIMLVDLGRNDVGRVSVPGSVSVDSFMQVEKYSHVMHIVSEVTGTLDREPPRRQTPYDAIRAVFPAGTVSGAPKIKAMQLVGQLEPDKRGLYAGAVGYISFSGSTDLCISIRTLLVKDQMAHLQAGGGIVYDSEPEFERQESINKMRALAKAIEDAERLAIRRSKLAAAADPAAGALRVQGPRATVSRGEDGKAFRLVDKIPETLQMNFGEFGGRYVSETLLGPLLELEQAYLAALADPKFHEELNDLFTTYIGRPTPLYEAKRLTAHCGGAKIWLKREDLCHTGAHKINNGIGMGLLAKRMGKSRVIAETGAGQHGVAIATACALLGLECVVFMGEEDMRRQELNVFRMRLLGTEVRSVTSGSRTLKDAVNAALRDWVATVDNTIYCIGSVVGPHPFPAIVRDFQSVIGKEIRAEFLSRVGRLPDVCVACVGGGSNAMGMFHPFLDDADVQLVGVEAAGHGIASGKHAASMLGGEPGVLHGSKTYLLQDEHGQVTETHSISAGLDYPGVGPEHAHLKASGRAKYVPVTDDEALEALKALSRQEGIIPALESSHAIYHGMKLAQTLDSTKHVVINLSGRGDKDMVQVMPLISV